MMSVEACLKAALVVARDEYLLTLRAADQVSLARASKKLWAMRVALEAYQKELGIVPAAERRSA